MAILSLWCALVAAFMLLFTAARPDVGPSAIALYGSVVAVLLEGVAAVRIKESQGRLKGQGRALSGLVLGILVLFVWLSPWHPANVSLMRLSRYRRAASDSQFAVTQAIRYANDKGVYPTRLKVLREMGYANLRDEDPWGNDYVLAPVLTSPAQPKPTDDVYVYSRDPKGTGTYTPEKWKWDAGGADTGRGGVVGYSSIYGSFRGR